MHEVGIMEGALDMARRLMEKRGGNRLRRVHMTIGSLSGVVPEALQSAFLALKDSYAAQPWTSPGWRPCAAVTHAGRIFPLQNTATSAPAAENRPWPSCAGGNWS